MYDQVESCQILSPIRSQKFRLCWLLKPLRIKVKSRIEQYIRKCIYFTYTSSNQKKVFEKSYCLQSLNIDIYSHTLISDNQFLVDETHTMCLVENRIIQPRLLVANTTKICLQFFHIINKFFLMNIVSKSSLISTKFFIIG